MSFSNCSKIYWNKIRLLLYWFDLRLSELFWNAFKMMYWNISQPVDTSHLGPVQEPPFAWEQSHSNLGLAVGSDLTKHGASWRHVNGSVLHTSANTCWITRYMYFKNNSNTFIISIKILTFYANILQLLNCANISRGRRDSYLFRSFHRWSFLGIHSCSKGAVTYLYISRCSCNLPNHTELKTKGEGCTQSGPRPMNFRNGYSTYS